MKYIIVKILATGVEKKLTPDEAGILLIRDEATIVDTVEENDFVPKTVETAEGPSVARRGRPRNAEKE